MEACVLIGDRFGEAGLHLYRHFVPCEELALNSLSFLLVETMFNVQVIVVASSAIIREILVGSLDSYATKAYESESMYRWPEVSGNLQNCNDHYL
jgi:hypothetical protein